MTVDLLMSRMGTLVSVADSADSDVYGNVTETETETSVRYELQQQARDEVPDPGAWQVGAYRLSLPAATSVAGVDRFIDDQGDTYEFDGPPEKVWNPRAKRYSHIEATVRRAS